MGKSRLDLLLQYAAAQSSNGEEALAPKPCSRRLKCGQLYERFFQHQCVSSTGLRHMLYQALALLREKGNIIMLIGGKGTGKTTMTKPAGIIFISMPTQQADSFCPLEKIHQYEIVLRQEFRYNPGHPTVDGRGLCIDRPGV